MIKPCTILLACAAVSLTACAQTTPSAPTRLESNPLTFHSNPVVSDGLTEQASALTANARAIVRASTVKGAITGAAIGCGLGLLAGAGAANCAKTAAVSAVSNAVMGNIEGKQDVKRRVTLASPNGLVRNLRKANDNFASIKTSLPDLLAQQDAEVTRLSLAYASNQISKEQHDTAVAAIRNDRANLAQALMLTSGESQKAAANLKTAAAQGHTGLEWHIAATEELARETLSARSTISLL